MNDKRFIELLNLYVDHQIAPEEAAELEAEILRSPARRKTYGDYCRMQRACGMLFDRERQEAPASFALEKSLQETERKILALPSRRKPSWGTYTAAFGGVAAMAACLAVVLLRPGAAPVANSNSVNVAAVAPVAMQANAPVVQMASLTPRSASFQPVFASQNFTAEREDAAAVPTERTGTEWMQQVQLAPVQRVIVDDTAFEAKPTLQQDNRVFRGSRPVRGNAEFTAFQFQR